MRKIEIQKWKVEKNTFTRQKEENKNSKFRNGKKKKIHLLVSRRKTKIPNSEMERRKNIYLSVGGKPKFQITKWKEKKIHLLVSRRKPKFQSPKCKEEKIHLLVSRKKTKIPNSEIERKKKKRHLLVSRWRTKIPNSEMERRKKDIYLSVGAFSVSSP